MNINLPELKAFVGVVRSGTFTAASANLNITQPALSRRIQLIEQALGTPLFERFPSGPRLTEAGRELLPHAEAVLTALDEGVEAVGSMVRGDRGRVAFAALGALCNSTVVEALRRFRDGAPAADLSLSFHASTSEEVSELVLQGQAMWGLRFRVDPRLHCEVIAHETMIIVCSPENPLADARSVTSTRLAEENWIGFPLGGGHSSPEFWSRLSNYGLEGNRVMLIDSTAAQKRLVEANFGIGLLPQGSVAEELRAGQLRLVNVSDMRSSVPVVLVRRKAAYINKAAASLEKHLVAAYSGT
jgi:DNA-binding transcriptional LysR family regulator